MSHHLLIKNNNGNATARQKPLKMFRTDKKQWENQKLEKESPQLSNTGGSRRRQYRKEYIENDSRRDMFN